MREPWQINKFISAEIPDPNNNPLEYKIVAEFMMHGPCGIIKPNSPCMKNSECSKKFSKQFKNETTIEELDSLIIDEGIHHFILKRKVLN